MRGIGVMAVGALLCISAPAKADILVTVSKSQQRLAVMIDGTEAYRWPVSTGVRGHDTPAGSFRPHDIERHWYSRQYKMTPMPWAVFFHRGYAVHGTTESYNLGRPASHGCVRLRPDNASILYALVRRQGMQNTKVVVMNGPLPPPPGAVPMADAAQAPDLAALQLGAGHSEDYAARARSDADTAAGEEIVEPAPRARSRMRDAVVYRVSVGSDEARILRERAAWLRSIDRKYGFAN